MSSAQAHSYLTGKARVQGPASGNAGSHIDLCCDMMDFLASTDACSSLADALADGLNHQSEQTLPTAAKKGGKKGGKAGTKSKKRAKQAEELADGDEDARPKLQVLPMLHD
jgi:hypothetical protein